MSPDVYQEVTDRVIAALEQGYTWHRPWNASTGQPRSLDGRLYHGINAVLLGLSEYSDPRWGTWKAIHRHGGKVLKGEKATRVILWKQTTVKDPESEGGRRTILLARYFSVWNAQQCEGIEQLPEPELSKVPTIDEADAVYGGYSNPPSLDHGGARACYSKVSDHVQMPMRESFESTQAYYLTQWHELVHSTGHPNRLARADLADAERFGDACYSREELTAEIGSAMIAARVGVVAPDIPQSAAYVAGWLRALRNDKRLVVQAAARAQKAADLILGEQGSTASE